MNVKKRLFARHDLFLVVACIISFVAACSSNDTDNVQSRISAVENNLIVSVINTGIDPAGMS